MLVNRKPERLQLREVTMKYTSSYVTSREYTRIEIKKKINLLNIIF